MSPSYFCLPICFWLPFSFFFFSYTPDGKLYRDVFSSLLNRDHPHLCLSLFYSTQSSFQYLNTIFVQTWQAGDVTLANQRATRPFSTTLHSSDVAPRNKLVPVLPDEQPTFWASTATHARCHLYSRVSSFRNMLTKNSMLTSCLSEICKNPHSNLQILAKSVDIVNFVTFAWKQLRRSTVLNKTHISLCQIGLQLMVIFHYK